MKKILTIMLSMLMVFSSCLMISADDWAYDQTTSLTVTYADEKLVFEVKGDNAEKYLSAVVDGSGYIEFHQNEPYFHGKITNKKASDITRDGNKLVVTKQTLLDRGYYSGEYYIGIYTSDTCISCDSIKIDLGSELAANRIDDLRLVGEIPTPKDGESTSIDKSTLYLADANGNKVSENEFDFYWKEQFISNDGTKHYVPMSSNTFAANKTYALAITYAYVGNPDYNNEITLAHNDQKYTQSSYSIFGPDANGEYADCKSDIVACNYNKTGGGSYLKTHSGAHFMIGEFVAKTSKDIEIFAKQDANGDLVISASGSDAKELIDKLYQGVYNDYSAEPSVYKWAYIKLEHSDKYQGYIENRNIIYSDNATYQDIYLSKVDDYTLKMTKEDLVKGNFIDGDYELEFLLDNNVTYPIVSLNLKTGVTFTPNMSSKIDIQVDMSAPVEGEKAEVDLSKIVVTDEKGNKLPTVDKLNGQNVGYDAFWVEKNDDSSKGGEYIQVEDDKFVAGKTYCLMVYYSYYADKGDYVGDTIEVTSNKNFTNKGSFSPFGFTSGTGLDIVDFTCFYASFEAGKVKLEETYSPNLKTEIASKVAIKNNSNEVQTLIPVEPKEKAAIASGKNLEVQMIVGSQRTVMEKNKDDVAKVETKVASDGLTKGAIYDISIYKNIEGETEKTPVTYTKADTVISFPLEDYLINTNSSINREYKVVRVHNGETTVLDATYDSATKSITFKTDKFSTYAICYKDSKKEEKKEESNTSSNTSSTKVVTCEEAMNSKNWTWSESKKACVYKVSNTSSK